MLNIPNFVTQDEIKKRYKELIKTNHPDLNQDINSNNIQKINRAYNILMEYIKNYRYSFDEEEIYKQLPSDDYIKKFKF
ncbi:MAG: J domain-containing protein [Epsilonproteobacteria bacterium]|nr:J domain-containing protein [Campylobacterota bacterium]